MKFIGQIMMKVGSEPFIWRADRIAVRGALVNGEEMLRGLKYGKLGSTMNLNEHGT